MNKIAQSIVLAATFCQLIACNNSTTGRKEETTTDSSKTNSAMIPDKTKFQATIDGRQTDLFVLKNHNGMTAAITNYGGRLVSLLVPDKNGKLTDVVVGFDSVGGYEKSTEPYYGAT